ncbi:MAG: hypothetical protein WCV67_10050 [Victivallaceae bacterium]
MLKNGLWCLCGVAMLFGNISFAAADGRELADANRKLWAERTRGTNLALGKKVIFAKIPNYHLTVPGGADEYDLTDGVLSSRNDDTIWFDSKAVGWYYNKETEGVNFMIDLGREQPVDRVVIRCLGGKSQHVLPCPKKFEVLVSKDGKKFYRTASMQKLMPGEKAQSDFRKYFYLEENGTAWTYPFMLDVKADIRYVGIIITGEADSVFADEMAVMEATPAEQKSPEFNQAYAGAPEDFPMKGVIVTPRIGKLAVSTNMTTPNALMIKDMRDKAAAGKPARLVMELPAGIVLESPKPVKQEEITANGMNYTRLTLPLVSVKNMAQTPMFFFKAVKPPAAGAEAVFYVLCDGEPTLRQSVPVELIAISEIKPFKRLQISLAWMTENAALDWPDFFDSWGKLGFNAVSSFPRNWNPKDAAECRKFLADARGRGFAIVMNESPFHIMAKGHKPGEELFSQIAGEKNSDLCPSYRGKFYDGEMARVAENVRQSRPDYVFWDIECWYNGALNAAKCATCREACKASGRPMDVFLKEKGTEALKDLYQAVEKGSAGAKMPLVASYNHHAAVPVHLLVVDFNQIYPQYVKQAQPSLYVAGRAQNVHDSIRKNYQLMKKNAILPWLSAGTYGEFESSKMEPMILEALLNGACGITYFCYNDFDTPLDFYYHARALAEIAPYEDLIMDGEVLEPAGSNQEFTYSGMKKGNEMLLLIGNYLKVKNTATTIELPLDKVSQIKDLRSGKMLKAEKMLTLDVPPGEIRLLYIKG